MDLFFVVLIFYIIVGLIYGLLLRPLFTATGRKPKIILVWGIILTAALVSTLVSTGLYTTGSLAFSLINATSSGIDSSVTSMAVVIGPSYSVRQANFHMSLWLHNPSDSYPVRYDDVCALVSYGSDPNRAIVVARARLQTTALERGAWFFVETRVTVDLEYEVAEAIIKEKEMAGEGSVGFYVTISAQVETQPLMPLSNLVWKHFATQDVKIQSLSVKDQDDIINRLLSF